MKTENYANLSVVLFVISFCHPAVSQTALSDTEFQRQLSFAQSGSLPSKLYVAKSYRSGSVVDQDSKRAFDWFSQAAGQGSLEAQSNIAVMYLTGSGTKRDVAQGLELLKETSNAGDPTGMTHLGEAYLFGIGGNQDYAKAIALFEAASKLGSGSATERLSEMYRNGDGVKFDTILADRLQIQAAAAGDDRAESRTADSYLVGRKDPAKAFAYYQLAAMQGEPNAQAKLGWMYANGVGTQQDFHSAAILEHRAALKGNAFAMEELGRLYWNGNGVTKSPVTAYVWIALAEKRSYRPATGLLKDFRTQMTPVDEARAEYLLEHINEFYQQARFL
jgi:uncharacterized protein